MASAIGAHAAVGAEADVADHPLLLQAQERLHRAALGHGDRS